MIHSLGLFIFALLVLLPAMRANKTGAKPKNGWWARYNRFLKSPRWRAVRYQVLRRDGYRCRRCGAPACEVRTTPAIGSAGINPAVLVSVCQACHERLHARKL